MAINIPHSTSPLNNLEDWRLDNRVLERLQGTGFDTFRNFGNNIRKNLALLSALISKYNVNTGCFQLGANGEISICFGLEDIVYLTGFPVDGKAVTGVDHVNPGSVCIKYLGVDGVVSTTKKGRLVVTSNVTFSWLRDRFMTVPDHVALDSPEFFYYVRAYVLYVIGCVIAPDVSGAHVSVAFLPLLEDVTEIKDFAWGAALLAHLHWSMSKIRSDDKPRKELSGCAYALMAFALERIPALALDYGFLEENLRESITQFPLLVSWSNGLQRALKNNFRNHSLAGYVQLLEGCKLMRLFGSLIKGCLLIFFPPTWRSKPFWASPGLSLFALIRSCTTGLI
ncbi:protein MAIN-LIKE 2-like [Actinidia eriantha]|uniref:protein MAIN-LIKE 2-like n=1 Tax=Actinidia eriantha TaxID=165200 RepID=UPI00258B0F46|nr:protein MAIN-LIKE 2-like [Actinidia eriantha]